MKDNIVSTIWDGIVRGFKFVIKGLVFLIKALFTFLDSIKMVFLIPLLSLASTIFTLVIIVLIQPVITHLPGFLGQGFVQSAIGGIIFIVLSTMIFRDRISKNLTFNVKTYLISFGGSLIMWAIPLIFLKRQGLFLNDFYTGEFLDFMSIFESISTFFYLTFFSPHFWLATITQEFAISVALGLILNGSIFIIFALYGFYNLGSNKDLDKKLTNENDL